MKFKTHSELDGKHAFILSPSNYHWLNYDDEKLTTVYLTKSAAARGTEQHEFAAMAIRLKQKLPKTDKTLNLYVNDAIGFRMQPEVPLYYSDNCFGTADAIGFRNFTLRIHDLKTGTSKPSMNQLLIYAALFCLEYKFKPSDLKIYLRIYYLDDFEELEATAEDVLPVMDKIVSFDKLISRIKEQEE